MTTHFWAPLANWGLAGSGIYDAALKGPEIINERMSGTQVVYSALFARFAWVVQPRNYLLASCHVANVCAQSNQLRRWGGYTIETDKEGGAQKVQTATMIAGGVGAGLAGIFAMSGTMQNAVINMNMGALSTMAKSPVGPFYVHFWAPAFKWTLSINNLLDYDRPVEKISTSMMSALALTGVLFSRWSMVIVPVNYNLLVVNVALAASSGYHLARKFNAEGFNM